MNSKKQDHNTYYPIIIGQKNYIGNSTFRYYFPSGTINLHNSSVAISSINMYYSWFNITTAFNNRIFTIRMPEGAGYAYYEIIIDEGFYTVDSLNSWLQNWFIQHNMYLIDENGDYVYYVTFTTNETYYKVQITTYEVPTTLPSGWINPGLTLPSVAGRFAAVTIGDSNNFGVLLGFSPNTYTGANLGNLIPQLSPVSSVIVQTPNLNNIYSNPNTNLLSFSVSNQPFGSMIIVEPKELVYVDATDTSIAFIDIRLVDQNYNNLAFLDIAVVINLIIKIRKVK